MTINNLLQMIEKKVEQVNRDSDGVRREILRIEAELHRIQPGVSVWIEDPIEVLNDTGWFLGYARIRGPMVRLAARRGSERPIALVNAPRTVRIAAAREMDNLLREMCRKLDRQDADILQATGSLA